MSAAAAAAAAAAATTAGAGPPSRSPIGCTTENPSPAAFNAWCKQHAVLWPKCTTGVSPDTGRCVLARAAIAEGEVVVEVPDDMVLMPENSSIHQLLDEEGLLKPAEDALLEVQGLIIAVMHEKALGAASKWAPYLSFLPDDMTHMAVYWTDDEVEELRGTAAHDKLVGRVQHPADAPTRVRQLFEELVVPLVLNHKPIAAATLGKGWRKLTREAAAEVLWPQYQWATAAVASYSFVLGDDHYQGMVAVWDLLNHVSGAVNVRLHHDADKGALQMVATQAIPKGAEVVNCYGNLSNAELLRGYGYVERGNSSTPAHVQVPAHFLIKAAAAAAAGPAAAAAAGPGGSDGEDEAAAGGSSDAAQDSGSAGNCDDDDDSDGDDVDNGDGVDDDAAGASSDDGDDSEDESEPEWDLSDDEDDVLQRQRQRQQPPTLPSLGQAQAQLGDWEERWQLCFSLGLLPKNGVFQVPSGGLAGVPPPLLAVLLVLLASSDECRALVAAAAALTDEAAAAAAAAAAAGAAAAAAAAAAQQRGSKSSGKHSRKRCAASEEQQQQQQQGGRKKRKGDQGGSGSGSGAVGAGPAALGGDAAAAAAGKLGLSDVEHRLQGFEFTSAATLCSALALLVRLMQSRYTASLDQDEALLQRVDSLAPRLAAAVVARADEKRVWQQLQQALQEQHAAQQLMQRAREGLAEQVQQLAHKAADKAAAAAAAARKKPSGRARHAPCCDEPGCELEHTHTHDGSGQHQHSQQQQKGSKVKDKHGSESRQKQQQPKRAGSPAAGAAEWEQQPQPAKGSSKRSKRGGQDPAGSSVAAARGEGSKRQKKQGSKGAGQQAAATVAAGQAETLPAAAVAAAAPADFSFNFQL